MERFLYLVKRKISGEAGFQEEAELKMQLEKNEILKNIYSTLFSLDGKLLPTTVTTPEEAYRKHLARMKHIKTQEERD